MEHRLQSAPAQWLGCVGSLVAHAGSSCGAWAPECAGSVVAVCGLSSCGMQAPLGGAWAPECAGSVVAVCGRSRCGVQS